MISPMLCHEVEIDGTLVKEMGVDGHAATAAYRKAITEELKRLEIRGYVAEPKHDGTRVIAIRDKAITLQNRHGVIYTFRLSDLVKRLDNIQGKWILDSEVVFINPETGREEFTACQRRCATEYPSEYFMGQYPLRMRVFDALKAGDIDLEMRPYYERKNYLQTLLAHVDEDVTYVTYESDLLKAWAHAVNRDLEGLIAKQYDSTYTHDRSYKWLKVKNWRFLDCNVVGYTPGTGARSFFFGSLVLQDKENGRFIGCAGSGFNEWEIRKFKDLFSDAENMPKPFTQEDVGSPYTAVKTDIRVLVKYYQITGKNVLRFPIFITS
jgi:ATP-dependent DNA ligase